MNLPNHDETQADVLHELERIKVESIGWVLIDNGAYLHVGSEEMLVEIVGLAGSEHADSNVLWIL